MEKQESNLMISGSSVSGILHVQICWMQCVVIHVCLQRVGQTEAATNNYRLIATV